MTARRSVVAVERPLDTVDGLVGAVVEGVAHLGEAGHLDEQRVLEPGLVELRK